MKFSKKILSILLIAVFVCAPLFAQEDKPALMTDRELSRFISDWPAVIQWLEAKGRQLDDAESSSPAAISALFAGQDFEAFLKSKGWTAERFGYVAGAAFYLMAYVEWERENPDIAKQFDQAIAETRANAALSAEDKAEMIQGLEEAKNAMMSLAEESDINEAELKLVRARYEDLKKLAESME